MEHLTKDEMNLIIQQLYAYERRLKHDIKQAVNDGTTSYEEYQDDMTELETVHNILDKLRGN